MAVTAAVKNPFETNPLLKPVTVANPVAAQPNTPNVYNFATNQNYTSPANNTQVTTPNTPTAKSVYDTQAQGGGAAAACGGRDQRGGESTVGAGQSVVCTTGLGRGSAGVSGDDPGRPDAGGSPL